MYKPWCFFYLLHLYLALNVLASQESSVEILTLHDSTLVASQSSYGSTVIPVAVSLPVEDLNGVSSSVVKAENWVRTNVLAHYPSTNITTIVVGHSVLCNDEDDNKLGLVLPSIKNLYYSLTRWGLQKEIKISTSFSPSCLNPDAKIYRADMAEKYIRPLLDFFQDVNAPYLVSSVRDLHTISDEIVSLVNSHTESMKKLGNFSLNKIYLNNIQTPKYAKLKMRKLSLMDSKYIDPFPARPTPLAPTSSSSSGLKTSPAFAARSPLPPLIGNISPPPLSLPFAPEMPPLFNPISPFNGPNLPPCIPSNGGGEAPAPPPESGVVHNGLWCVAKPSVPPETLQEALDYACGEGGADCEAIGPSGNCYYPNTVVAHASFAFNSYWQRTRENGGTCGFGGTAMLINSDPSYHHCRFNLA